MKWFLKATIAFALLYLIMLVPAHAQSLYTFSPLDANQHNADGANPQSIIQGADGNFYGVATSGGVNGSGTVFKITRDGHLALLHTFSALDSNGYNADGAYPLALIQGTDGNFYGVALLGGTQGSCCVFKITPQGNFTTLHSYAADGSDGEAPMDIVQGLDGNYYGVTAGGGANGNGTIFKTTSDGNYTILYTFSATDANGNNADGTNPQSILQGAGGNLYGIATSGGANGNGTIFKITTKGNFNTIYTFSPLDSSGYNADGANPQALIQAADGNLYGVATAGGTCGSCTIFKITTAGHFTTLHSFAADGSDGDVPMGIMEGIDGKFYGVTAAGGANDTGTVYEITSDGSFTTLYSFSSSGSNGNNADGSSPGSLIEDANSPTGFDIAANAGGANSTGTIAQVVHTPSHHALLFQNASSGQLAVWYMYGVAPFGGDFATPVQDPAWKAVGDDDQQSYDDPYKIFFQNPSAGRVAVWDMSNMKATNGQMLSSTPPAGWNVISMADFNKDGIPDLLLQNANTGQLAIWYMNGDSAFDGTYVTPTPSANWDVVGSLDFNGDGNPDLLFQNRSTGQLVVWFMNGNTAVDGVYLADSVPSGWKCVSLLAQSLPLRPAGYVTASLVFQNTSTGQLAYWLLSGTQVVDGNFFSYQPASGWHVAGPH
ncbi:MAG TPA: choice-of-anchor tandem repeat GloVer-containing protein [Chthonomonadaceae bacterium]|nr:choice-of-anchor tandem repeat GloVer-containing protein [Chthonomonadaceae bacterium]